MGGTLIVQNTAAAVVWVLKGVSSLLATCLKLASAAAVAVAEVSLSGTRYIVTLVTLFVPYVADALHWLLVNTANFSVQACRHILRVFWDFASVLLTAASGSLVFLWDLLPWLLYIAAGSFQVLLLSVWSLCAYLGHLVFSLFVSNGGLAMHVRFMEVAVGAALLAGVLYGLLRSRIALSTALLSAGSLVKGRTRRTGLRPSVSLRSKDDKRRPLSDTAVDPGKPSSGDYKSSPPFAEEPLTDRNAAVRRELEEVRQRRLCVVCLDKEKEVVLKPCRHLCMCAECVLAVEDCPICRKIVSEWELIFDS